jgi:hypothetical protein
LTLQKPVEFFLLSTLKSTILSSICVSCYLYVVLEFYSSGGVDVAFFESCTDLIVGLTFVFLDGADDGRLIYVPLSINIDLSEYIRMKKAMHTQNY